MQLIRVLNETTALSSPLTVSLLNTARSRLNGLMFQRVVDFRSGVLLSIEKDSIINSSIHMLFMNFNIAAIWINSKNVVVDTTIAQRWHLAYFPASPAKYVLETHPDRIFDFKIGDSISFHYE